MKARIFAGFALFVAALGPAAGAQSSERLERAEVLLGSARFDEADAEIAQALASGTLGRPELARAHSIRGVIAAARRQSDAARASFRRALSLVPDLELPASAGPHVKEELDAARAELGERGRGLEVRVSVTADRGVPARVGVRVSGDPEGLARRLSIVAGSVRLQRSLPPRVHDLEIARPAAGCVDVSAKLTDASGNQIWADGALGRLCAEVVPGARAPGAHEPERPVGAPVWVGLALTGAGAVATGVLGAIALDRRAEFHDANADGSRSEAERRALYDDAQAAQRRATVAGIATGVLGATTLTLYLLRPEESAPAVGMRALPGGAGAVLDGRF